jgi:hypothetical protein
MGKRGPKRKLTDEQIIRVWDLYLHSSCSISQIAKHFDVSPTLINNIVDRKPPYDSNDFIMKEFFE